jgi:hypothetical protein
MADGRNSKLSQATPTPLSKRCKPLLTARPLRDDGVQNGVRFLLDSQFADGS